MSISKLFPASAVMIPLGDPLSEMGVVMLCWNTKITKKGKTIKIWWIIVVWQDIKAIITAGEV